MNPFILCDSGSHGCSNHSPIILSVDGLELTCSATLYPWYHVLVNGDEPSFLLLIGLSRVAFENKAR